MVETGKLTDDSAANKKNQTAQTETETRSDVAAKTADVAAPPETQTSAIEQIAVDNQTGTLPGSKPSDRSQVDGNGQLEITPLDVAASDRSGGDPKDSKTAISGDAQSAETKPGDAKPEEPKVRTRAEELAQTVPYASFQDGRTDAIDLTVQRASLLPKGDKAREMILRDLADSFENGKTYGERVRAAKALLELTREKDGSIPASVVDRDVVIPEKGHWTQSFRNSPSKYVVDSAARHEMKPLASAEVLKFLNNSADTIEQQTKALKDAPADSHDKHNLQQKLLSIFQTYGQDSPEKVAAAKGLLELNRRPDGSYPADLGTRDIEHGRQTRKERGREVLVKAAWTEHITTKLTDVQDYLAKRSEGLLADTARVVEARSAVKPEATATNQPEMPPTKAEAAPDTAGLNKRAVSVFFDSTNSADKTAAAIALLELGKGSDGTISDQLGSRTVHIPAKTQTVSHGRGGTSTKVLEPARDRIDSVSKTDAASYLQSQLGESTYPRTRMMAADALKGAGIIDEKRHAEIVKAVLSDDRTPEALKTQLRNLNSLDVRQEALKRESDGRIIQEQPSASVPLDTTPGGTRDKMQVLMEKLVTIPALKDSTTPEQIEAMNKELSEGRFGAASRDIYNKSATYMSDMATGLAVNIVARNGKLPEGLPMEVPKDNSGRAIGDDLLRAQLITGRIKMEVPPVKPGEIPDVDGLTDTALWNVKAAKEFDNMNLRWEVAVFDDRLQAFNKDGKLDAWKSTDNMSIDDMRKLQTSRGEWLQLGMQVRNYAHAIHYFNKATQDASNIPRLSISQAEFGVFSDEALSDKNFPGKVTRENGKITNVEIDLPTTLDRSDPANLEKVAKMRAWLEKYGPKVDQVTEEITKATLESGRVAMWGDIEHEGIDKATGKPYNFTSLRISADTVKIKLPDGTEEERIRVVSSKQNRYAGGLSLYKTVGDIQDVGPPETSGEVKVNGKVLSLDAGENGVAVGAKGDIAVTGDGVSPQHARMRVAADGRIFIKDNDSATGTYVGGQRIDSSKWVEVFPDQKVTLGKPPAALDIERKENGEVTFNGQTLKVGEPAKIGTSCAINVTGDGVSSEHALVKVDADGKVFIKDNNSEKGTYVNGKKVGANDWTQVNDSDKVTFGPPAADLDIKADVRLYKKGDMVTVLVDGQMQLMPAENIKAWTTEAATWHWTGKGAMAAMDLGMLVSGGIALKGVQVAAVQGAKEAGALTAKAVLARMVTTPGFARGAWHLGLGATGLLHQSIENTGPYGKKFMEFRGYAMMGEIFYGSFIKDGAAVARKAFGMTAAPAETGSALSSYLKASPWANRAMNVTDGMFLAMNGYFLPEIAAHQMPAIMTSIRKHDAARLLEAGMLLRDEKYERADASAPRVTLEDQVRKFADDRTRDLITQAKAEAEEKAAMPDDQKKAKQDYVETLTNQFLNPKNDSEKTAAAFGLLAFQARSANNGRLPEILGTRWRSTGDLPDNVTATQVKAYLNSKIPASINLHDKELQARVEANYGDVALVAEKPADHPDRKALNEKMIREFVGSSDENTKVAAAMGLMLLNENGGKLPESMGSARGADGGLVEVKAADVRNLLTKHQSNTLTDRFDDYASSMKGSPKVEAVLKTTREFLAESELPPAVLEAEQIRLMKLFQTSTDREEKAAVALSLLFLSTDKTTGAIPSTLATQHFRVEREYKSAPYAVSPGAYSPVMPPTVTVNKIPVSLTAQEKSTYATTGSISDFRGGKPSKVEIEARKLQTADVMQFLKANMPGFTPNTRMAVSDVLYRANEAPMAGGSALTDQGGVLLSIVEDKNAQTEARIQALINPHGVGLADVMEIHRFETEPGIRRLPDREASATEADLYGRDSKAMEKALLDIVADQSSDKDLKAIASATLMANSETDPTRRREMLARISQEYDSLKTTPGAYYNQTFKAESDVLNSMWKDDEFKPEGDEGRSRLYRSAIVLSQSGNWKEFGISDEKMARALEATFIPQQPIVAQHTLDPLLRHYNDLDDYSKQINRENFKSLIGSSQGGVNTPGYLLRQDVINRVGEISKVLGPDFTTMAREQFVAMLTPGTDQFRSTDENVRAAAVRGLGQIGSNDLATQELLKRVLGDGKTSGDSSAMVRSAALDGLAALHPADMNVLAANLLKSETDPEILRKLGNIEKSTRRLDPDSAEYREQFRQAYNRLMEASANKYSLAEVPNFIAKNYPMLDWQNLNNTVFNRMKENEGSWKWASTKYEDIVEPYYNTARAEMLQQLDSIVSKAATPGGDMERRTLAWIVMSNGKFMDEATKQQALEKASFGLYNAAKVGDAKTKESVAPLLLMAVATQDRMPPEIRHKIVNGITWLDPGAPGSPVAAKDAGVAILAGLKRQFERTPRDGNDPGYKASHELQMQMLNIYSRYAGQESIPILEAMVASQNKFALSRDTSDRVTAVKYPDESSRSVDYDGKNEVWKVTTATRDGAGQTLVRKGSSDEWYLESDYSKKTFWRGNAEFDQISGAFKTTDSFGKTTIYGADGSIVEKTGTQVTKVIHPDKSSRELNANRETFVDASGAKQIWVRDGITNNWYRDTDKRKQTPRVGTLGFDEDGNYVSQQQGQPKSVIRPDGSRVTYDGSGLPLMSTPSAADNSAHPMPMVRERAQELLNQLRDGTDILRRNTRLDTTSSAQQLADNLKLVLEKGNANSEEVAKAIFTAALSKPIDSASDPRRDVLRVLLEDKHEKVRLAAARVLFDTGVATTGGAEVTERNRVVSTQDKERAALVLADLYKNGSRAGYRDEAGRLIRSVLDSQQTGQPRSGSAQILDAAMERTPDARRPDIENPNQPHSIDQQEKYEQATGAMIRDTQISLDQLSDSEWWKKHGFGLLEANSFKNAMYETADNVSFNMWEKLVYVFDGDPAQKKFQAALDNLNNQRGEQLGKLKERALSNDNGEEATTARKALALIVLSNGYPLSPEIRSNTVKEAAITLSTIYRKGGPAADYAEQIITAALVANPGIKLDVRAEFVSAVRSRLAQDASVQGNSSNVKAATLLAAALEAEHYNMPQKGQPGYEDSIYFQSNILMHLDRLGENIAMPVIEAMANGHPDADLRRRSASLLNEMRDGTDSILGRTIPDTTTSNADKAKALTALLQRKDSPAREQDTIRELFRLAHPRTLLRDDPNTATDPRLEPLRNALKHDNERIRLAAASALWSSGDPRAVVALSDLQDSKRPGVREEAERLFGASLIREQVKLSSDSERYLRGALEENSGRTRVTAAKLLLDQYPQDAEATAAIAKAYGSSHWAVKTGATELIQRSLQTPITDAADPRRIALDQQLKSDSPGARLAAAWMLSTSSVSGDYEKATQMIGKLAFISGTRSDAQSLLKDFIAHGSDKQQEAALASWNAAWREAGTPDAEKPPAPTEIDQARKFFQQANASERSAIFSLPEAEKKALVMQLTGISEADLEAQLEPAPIAEVTPRARNPFDPFKAFDRRSDLMFPLPGTPGADNQLFGLSSRFQPPANTAWNQAIPGNGDLSIAGLEGGKAHPYFAGGQKAFRTGNARDTIYQSRLSVANFLQENSRTEAKINVTPNGKLELRLEDGQSKPAHRIPFLENPEGDEQIRFGKTETAPEFSDFLDYLHKQRPDVLSKPTIKSSELSIMFLQYLRQREAGLQTGFVMTPTLYDNNVAMLTSDPRAVPWYSNGLQRSGFNERQWRDFSRHREQMRNGNLDAQLAKALSSEAPNGSGPHWRPVQKAEVTRPEMLAKPAVERLEVNRFDYSNILPRDLFANRQSAIPRFRVSTKESSTRPFVIPGTDSNADSYRFLSTESGGVFSTDIEIPTASLVADRFRTQNSDRITVLRSPSEARTVQTEQTYNLSPAAREILKRYRLIQLKGQVDTLNRTAEAGK